LEELNDLLKGFLGRSGIYAYPFNDVIRSTAYDANDLGSACFNAAKEL
jgi:hypothetical protein